MALQIEAIHHGYLLHHFVWRPKYYQNVFESLMVIFPAACGVNILEIITNQNAPITK
jgi:hypothetical protein